MPAITAGTGHLIWYNQLIKHDTHGCNAAWSDSLATTKADINETREEGSHRWNKALRGTRADAQANGRGTV